MTERRFFQSSVMNNAAVVISWNLKKKKKSKSQKKAICIDVFGWKLSHVVFRKLS